MLQVIETEAARINRMINVLLEVHTAAETTKSGFLPEELLTISPDAFPHVNICGLMTMATNTDDEVEIRRCFRVVHGLALAGQFRVLSFGMSNDYLIAVEEGSNMVRIGSAIFGERTYN